MLMETASSSQRIGPFGFDNHLRIWLTSPCVCMKYANRIHSINMIGRKAHLPINCPDKTATRQLIAMMMNGELSAMVCDFLFESHVVWFIPIQ